MIRAIEIVVPVLNEPGLGRDLDNSLQLIVFSKKIIKIMQNEIKN